MTRKLAALLFLLVIAGCATDDPSPDGETPGQSPTAGVSATATAADDPDVDPLLLTSGDAGNGIAWELRVVPGDTICVQLRRTTEAFDFLVCDEDSEQDFNGDENLRYGFGGLNQDQVPKFVTGITSPEVARVRIDLSGEGPAPEAETLTSSEVEDRRFFVVPLPSEPAQEVLAVRGLDSGGKTVAGFRLGPPEEAPSPLPTG